MNNSTQRRWIIGIPRGVARVALALAVVLVAAFVATRSARAQTESVLYSFTGGTDGSTPVAGLVQDAQGNLYSTTYAGGGTGGE